ncbi:MAG: hypothetical protein AB8B63_20565 [Granulosicoccus sp.]
MVWYQKYIVSPAYHQQYKSAFRGTAHWFNDPEDAFAAALEQLFYVKLPKKPVQPPKNPDGFVMASFQNVLIDLSRAENGRLRSPRELQRRGPEHEALFFKIREGFKPVPMIIDESPLPAESVKETIAWIKANAWMPLRPPRAELEHGETGELRADIEKQANTATNPVLDSVEAEQQLAMLNLVLQPLDDAQSASQARNLIGMAALSTLNAMREDLALDTMDRALLNEFKHGTPSVNDISDMLNVPKAEVQRRKKGLIPRIEAVFTRHGFFAPLDSASPEHDPGASAPGSIQS